MWIDADDGTAPHGICASYAAGAVRCDGTAVCGPFLVRRGLFTTHGAAETIPTWAGEFAVRLAASASPEGLALAIQERMAEAELDAAEAACADGDVDLVVVDGPLRGRQHLSGAVGYIKTHHVTYLAPELNAVVGRLASGERSPLFILGTDWSRLSWYFRLAGNRARHRGPVSSGANARRTSRCQKPPRWPTRSPPRSPASPPKPTRTAAPRRTSTPSPASNGSYATASATRRCSTAPFGWRPLTTDRDRRAEGGFVDLGQERLDFAASSRPGGEG